MSDKQLLTVGILFFVMAVNIIVLYTKLAVLTTHIEALEAVAKHRAAEARK